MNTYQKQTAPAITHKQKEILFLLHSFRFLTTHQLQRLLNHKEPRRIKAWLHDLRIQGYCHWQFERRSYATSSTPAIYCLTAKAGHILKEEKGLTAADVSYLYKEHKRTKQFIEHALFLADVYLYLKTHTKNNETVKFFTKTDLKAYPYFPDPMPDAYVALKGRSMTRRYFLNSFDASTPSFVYRKRVRMYLAYITKPDWDENTNETPFPAVLLILPTESAKKHIRKYTQALLAKTYEDTPSFYLTTTDKLHAPGTESIWESVT